jgi:formamidopyrimidine-DNA glycosylase
VPELPDVELFKRYLDATALHRRVEGISLSRGERLLQGISERSLRRRLRGRALESTRRHGKFLFVALDDGAGALVLHFGMTGFLAYYRRPESAPEHPRLVLDLDDGYRLAYDCQRLFGEIGYVDSSDRWIEQRGLGPDALALDASGFAQRLRGRRGSLKSALMNQGVVAGLGNVYSDEALFRARLHPRTPVAHLDERALRGLHRAVRAVLEGAIHYRADPERMPRSWLLPHRREGAHCPRCGEALERTRIGQRSAWLCPSCQRRR